jgi:hypothetical protein
MAHGLEEIDWNAPWLQAWRARGQPLAQAVLAGQSCAQALNTLADSLPNCPVRFVPQSDLPPGQAYEAFVFDTQQVPTRDGLHDFFNGLCWLHFPHTKQRLNQLQAAQIARSGIAPVRGPARDALTVFDENAALLHAPDALWDALVRKDWRALFGPLRPLWQAARLQLFGHALLEKLVHPRTAITAHVYRVQAVNGARGNWDPWLGTHLQADALADKPFAHLPVLGVPGWWPGNAVPGFYDDVSVFRPPRHAPV